MNAVEQSQPSALFKRSFCNRRAYFHCLSNFLLPNDLNSFDKIACQVLFFFFFSEKKGEKLIPLVIRLPASLSRSWLKSGKSPQRQEKYESPPPPKCASSLLSVKSNLRFLIFLFGTYLVMFLFFFSFLFFKSPYAKMATGLGDAAGV